MHVTHRRNLRYGRESFRLSRATVISPCTRIKCLFDTRSRYRYCSQRDWVLISLFKFIVDAGSDFMAIAFMSLLQSVIVFVAMWFFAFVLLFRNLKYTQS